jgi:predicted hydrolase (HD superfamily)
MNLKEANEIFNQLITSESLKRHCISVALVMEAYAMEFNQNAEEWYITGLLHDADYEKYPSEHPNIIVNSLKEKGEHRIAHAISAHHTKWGQTYDTNLDKFLLAVDELTGFIIAVSYMRPGRFEGMTVSSVVKKLKTKGFAEGVDREEIEEGIRITGLEKDKHIEFIIKILSKNQSALGIV